MLGPYKERYGFETDNLYQRAAMLALAWLQAEASAAQAGGLFGAFFEAWRIMMEHWFAYGGQTPMLFFTSIDYHQYFVISCLIFCMGFYGVAARRNAVSMLLSMELMLNAVNINMSAFNLHWGPKLTRAAFTQNEDVWTNMGQVFSVFTIIIAAAEAAVGLAIIIAFYRARKSVMLDDANLMKW
jgi:NADH-quinone oxidoreductase subunit K